MSRPSQRPRRRLLDALRRAQEAPPTAYLVIDDIPERPPVLPGLTAVRSTILRGAIVFQSKAPDYGITGDDEISITLQPNQFPAYAVPKRYLRKIVEE